jgi:hypothetical protein
LLSAANFSASALRNAELGNIKATKLLNFASSFGDATVTLPAGLERPCQWDKTILSDLEYFGRWEGWLDSIGESDFELRNDKISAIYPAPECIPRLKSQ